MEIIPKLNLNRNPKDIPSGSLVAAKNMMVDDTGSYFTNEYGFDVAFECKNDDEYICGVIPTNKELVVFTYSFSDGKSRIYKYKDGKYNECNLGWKYSGGKITGSYTYNYKGELIIAVGEYDATDANGNSIQIPYKCWNLDDCIDIDHNQEEEIDKFSADYELISGSLVCGVYTFFIRFAVSSHDYTKWFQLTSDIPIIQLTTKEAPTHVYLNGDVKTTLDVSKFNNLYVNTNSISDKGIHLIISGLEISKFDKFQIGYIIKHDEEVLGRIQNEYDIINSKLIHDKIEIDITTNEYLEEESIDNILKNPNQLYNVKNIINYNNRLYLSNYEEYKNKNIVASRWVNVSYKAPAGKINENVVSVYKAVGQISAISVYSLTFSINCSKVTTTDSTKYVIKDIDTFVKEYLVKSIRTKNPKTGSVASPYENISGSIDNDNTYKSYKNTFNVWLFKRTSNVSDMRSIYDSNTKKVTNVTSIYIQNNKIYVECGNITFNLSEDSYQVQNYLYLYHKYDLGYDYVWQFINDETYPGAYSLVVPKVGYGYEINVNVVDQSYSYIVDKTRTERSLIRDQYYNIYIHYIRKDGSYTLGYPVKKIKAYPENGTPANDNVFYFNFNAEIPEGYVGYFFSYEDIEYNVIPTILVNKENKTIKVTNTDFIYSNTSIYGNKINNVTVGGTDENSASKVYNRNGLTTPNLEVNGITSYNALGDLINVYSDTNNLYTKKIKTLYRLTKNYYESHVNINDTNYIPNFYNRSKVICFVNDKDELIEIIANAASNKVLDKTGAETTYKVKLYNDFYHSVNMLDAYNIKQDYSKGAVSLVTTEGKTMGIYYNAVLSPDKLHDFLEIKSAYTSKPSKSFTNYSEEYTDTFNKTIRRSNVISDESLVNGFRIFESEQYKIIKENKGDITNIVGIGLYLLVHTQYSLFVFDRSPKLTQSSQLQIPDTFDVDYQEVLPSNEGFGGLWNKEEAIVSKNGYIWYDRVNKYIFKYENGKVSVLSSDINNFIKDINVETIRFGEDLNTNRLLICVYIKANNSTYTITLSYNFNTNTFISMHDYSFTNCYRTYNEAFFFDANKDRCRLYSFNKDSNTYHNLVTTKSLYYPIL